MQENFERAVAVVLDWEGGYVNDFRDPGGETKYGISKQAHPELDIFHLSLDEAKQIYWDCYWKPCRCDELPDGLDLIVFDGAVQHGAVTAARLLQEILGAEVDGIIGPKTVEAAIARWKEAYPGWLLRDYAAERGKHYGLLPQFQAYGRGWMRRLMEVLLRAEFWRVETALVEMQQYRREKQA